MNPQLKSAINAFILNEFKLEPKELDPDLNFSDDLGLSENQTVEFLQKMQEALSISIPEDKITQIKFLEDLYSILDADNETIT